MSLRNEEKGKMLRKEKLLPSWWFPEKSFGCIQPCHWWGMWDSQVLWPSLLHAFSVNVGWPTGLLSSRIGRWLQQICLYINEWNPFFTVSSTTRTGEERESVHLSMWSITIRTRSCDAKSNVIYEVVMILLNFSLPVSIPSCTICLWICLRYMDVDNRQDWMTSEWS